MKSFDQQVADWARTKPADEAYDYEAPSNCALCQFLLENGFGDDPRVAPRHWYRNLDAAPVRFEDELEAALIATPWTFGALADRLSA